MQLFATILEFLALGAALRIALRLVYGTRGPARSDQIYFILDLAVKLLWAFALGAMLVLFAGFAGILLWIIALFAVAMILRQRILLRRKALLSIVIRTMECGAPLPEVLRGFSHDYGHGPAHKITQLADALEQGHSLSAAMLRSPGALPVSAYPAARVGAELNAIPAALRSVAEAERQHDQVWLAVSSQITYLLILLAMGTLVLTFCLVKIAPAFEMIFFDFEIELPPMTARLFSMDDWFATFWPVGMLLLQVVLVFLLLAVARSFGFFINFPVLNRLNSGRARSDVLGALALAAERGRPFNDVLIPLSESYQSSLFAGRMHNAAQAIERGEPWCDSLERFKLVRSAEAAVLKSAERLGNLPWALRELSGQASRREGYWLKAMMDIISPMAVLAFAGCVGFFVIAMFVPLIKLIVSLTR